LIQLRTASSRIALATRLPQMGRMTRKTPPAPRPKPHPLYQKCMLGLGFLLLPVALIVGPIPGPGGIIVFAAGMGLILRYSGWAKRLYVRFKRKHPKKGRWADWGLRRASARRREERRKRREAGHARLSD
jgi:hypothetical protein